MWMVHIGPSGMARMQAGDLKSSIPTVDERHVMSGTSPKAWRSSNSRSKGGSAEPSVIDRECYGTFDETCSKTYYQVMNKPFKPTPVLPIMADVSVSISELKANPAAVIAAARKQQVAITSRNRPVAYVVSPEVWDHILDVFDEGKFAREFADRLNDPLEDSIAVDIEDLLK